MNPQLVAQRQADQVKAAVEKMQHETGLKLPTFYNSSSIAYTLHGLFAF